MNLPVNIDATALFRAAYENRYTWDTSFPGYSADVTYKHGEVTFSGQAKVVPDARMGFKGEVSGIENEDVLKAVQGQLWEIAIHRVRRPFEQTHAGNSFELGSTDADGAVQVMVLGKGEGDHYKVRNNEVSLVHRHIHGTVVTINTFSTFDTGEGYLSATYDSVYHDPATGAQKGEKQVFEDSYEKVGDFYILNRRVITTETDGSVEYCFSNFQLL
ncbi:MAG: DUF3386 domain-containing protein [Synechococcales bacterium]|nr:DUF3386 domain-containing protein [Synechococcales bacterium]